MISYRAVVSYIRSKLVKPELSSQHLAQPLVPYFIEILKLASKLKWGRKFYRTAGIRIRDHHHHHISVMELGHLMTHFGLTYPEVSSNVYHDSFCQLGSRISLLWVIYFEAFYLHVVSGFSCIPVICTRARCQLIV